MLWGHRTSDYVSFNEDGNAVERGPSGVIRRVHIKKDGDFEFEDIHAFNIYCCNIHELAQMIEDWEKGKEQDFDDAHYRKIVDDHNAAHPDGKKIHMTPHASHVKKLAIAAGIFPTSDGAEPSVPANT
jgi:hypothetical protein